ncbi:Hypothetical predicted protein [Mytilus galloprovincialis]|uniref:CCHC-type domain-containing protein n=1 Tax=Mytilus galloprovincialis TaxID=29158 RepID=A0A8B6FKQ8_MYTGA|nr:Hypothetical predicted protein [Mytilus galloprovincialis]
MDSELFQSLVLSTGQSLEDDYSQILEKAQILQKPDHEVVAKFISGLPDKMSFSVCAGQPIDIQSSLTAAKLAEACGYRQHNDVVNAMKHRPQHQHVKPPEKASELSEMKEQIKLLTALVSKMNTGQQSNTRNEMPPSNDLPRQSRFDNAECRKCKGLGHFQRACNWNSAGPSQLNVSYVISLDTLQPFVLQLVI